MFLTNHNSANATTSSWTAFGTARLAYGALDERFLKLAVNGGTPVYNPSVVQGAVTTAFQGPLNIGANSHGNEYWHGSISEVIFYDRVVTAVERQRINSYLALKYGFSLDQTPAQSYLASGSALMWDHEAPGASTYNNGLFGIGRDDASGLSQIKSIGQTATNLITVEAVGEGTNTAPAFSDMDDLEFLVIGDNNGAASWTTVGAPTGYSILERKWMRQEQGDVGDVTLSFDVDNPAMNVPAALGDGKYYFIYDTDGDGSLANESPTALTDLGGGIWQNTVNFGAGGLFTLATTAQIGLNTVSPPHNAVDVAVDTDLTLTFSRAVQAGAGSLALYRAADDALVTTIPAADTTRVTITGATVVVDPTDDLVAGTQYYVLIGSDAFQDGSGSYGGISNKNSWSFTTLDDDDGVPADVENDAPNGGDGNDDGILDSTQPNVASLVNPVTDEYLTLALSDTCRITSVSVVDEAAVEDPGFVYETGLVNFSADCTTSPISVEIFQYGITAEELVLRKHDPQGAPSSASTTRRSPSRRSAGRMSSSPRTASRTTATSTSTLLSGRSPTPSAWRRRPRARQACRS